MSILRPGLCTLTLRLRRITFILVLVVPRRLRLLSLWHLMNTQLHAQWSAVACCNRCSKVSTRLSLLQHTHQLIALRITQRRIAADGFQQLDRIGRIGHVVPLFPLITLPPCGAPLDSGRCAGPSRRIEFLQSRKHRMV